MAGFRKVAGRVAIAAGALAVAAVTVALAETYMLRRQLGAVTPVSEAVAAAACTLAGLVGADCTAKAGQHYVTEVPCTAPGASADCFAASVCTAADQGDCFMPTAVQAAAGKVLAAHSGATRWADGTAAQTCRHYLTGNTPQGYQGVANSASHSGPYWITGTAGGAQFRAWCDMGSDGGGWTLVMSNVNGQAMGELTTSQSETELYQSAKPAASAKFTDARINQIAQAAEYRYICGRSSESLRYFLLSKPYATVRGLMDTAQRCKVSYSAGWQTMAFTSANSNPIGLYTASDGCGTCADACGAGSNAGMWHSWYANGSQQGCYQRQIGYSDGFLYVR